jgi:hypothetical protein
MKEKLGEKQR